MYWSPFPLLPQHYVDWLVPPTYTMVPELPLPITLDSAAVALRWPLTSSCFLFRYKSLRTVIASRLRILVSLLSSCLRWRLVSVLRTFCMSWIFAVSVFIWLNSWTCEKRVNAKIWWVFYFQSIFTYIDDIYIYIYIIY